MVLFMAEGVDDHAIGIGIEVGGDAAAGGDDGVEIGAAGRVGGSGRAESQQQCDREECSS